MGLYCIEHWTDKFPCYQSRHSPGSIDLLETQLPWRLRSFHRLCPMPHLTENSAMNTRARSQTKPPILSGAVHATWINAESPFYSIVRRRRIRWTHNDKACQNHILDSSLVKTECSMLGIGVLRYWPRLRIRIDSSACPWHKPRHDTQELDDQRSRFVRETRLASLRYTMTTALRDLKHLLQSV